jgi:hypothetical protein
MPCSACHARPLTDAAAGGVPPPKARLSCPGTPPDMVDNVHDLITNGWVSDVV